MRLRATVLSLLSTGMALFLLVHFIFIWLFGQVIIYESSLVILVAETVMMVGIVGFSSFCVLTEFRRTI